MGKMGDLQACIIELRDAAISLNAVALGLEMVFGGDEAEAEAQQEPPVPEPKPITLEQVRAVLAEKSRGGHTDAVRALLKKHGADRLSEIDPNAYAALLAEAEVLGNG